MNNQSAIAVCAGAVQVGCIRNRPCIILWLQPGIPCIKCPAQFCVLFRLQLYSRMIALWARCILGAALFAANAAASTTTGKAALFIPLAIAASLFQYIRFARFRQPAFCGRFARRAVQLLPGAGVWGEYFPGFGVVQHILKPQPDPLQAQPA